MILTVGDKIVHVLHGPGVIQNICERQINGTPCQFYLIRIVATKTDIYLPISETDQVRPVIERSDLHKLEKILRSPPKPLSRLKDVRYSVIEQQLTQRHAFHLAEVIRDLLNFMKKRSAISMRDQDCLRRAQNMLCAELALVEDISQENAQKWIYRALKEGIHTI